MVFACILALAAARPQTVVTGATGVFNGVAYTGGAAAAYTTPFGYTTGFNTFGVPFGYNAAYTGGYSYY